MKLERAIEILTHYDTDLDAWNDEPNDEAVKLGIEAMKRVQDRRNKNNWFGFDALPGETEE